jgi:hypothetical protein
MMVAKPRLCRRDIKITFWTGVNPTDRRSSRRDSKIEKGTRSVIFGLDRCKALVFKADSLTFDSMFCMVSNW